MEEAVKAIAQHVIAYAMLQRASGVINEKEYAGIQVALNQDHTDNQILTVCGLILHALNDTYERKLTKWIESNSIIVRP